MASSKQIEQFLNSQAFGVVGASRDRNKYGNRVLRKYLSRGLKAYPVHPREPEIEGLPCYASVLDLPAEVASISIITPPQITETVVAEAIQKGIRNIWMQPGAESAAALRMAEAKGLNVIADGSCLLVTLG